MQHQHGPLAARHPTSLRGEVAPPAESSVIMEPCAALSPSQERLKAREELFARLERLGFDRAEQQARHTLVFHKNMFSSPNSPGMVVLVHFLLTRILPPNMLLTYFEACWPVEGDKERERRFRTQAHSALVALEKKGLLPSEFARLSLLHSCSGDRFYALLLKLSELAMEKDVEFEPSELPPIAANIQSISSLKLNTSDNRPNKEIMRGTKPVEPGDIAGLSCLFLQRLTAPNSKPLSPPCSSPAPTLLSETQEPAEIEDKMEEMNISEAPNSPAVKIEEEKKNPIVPQAILRADRKEAAKKEAQRKEKGKNTGHRFVRVSSNKRQLQHEGKTPAKVPRREAVAPSTARSTRKLSVSEVRARSVNTQHSAMRNESSHTIAMEHTKPDEAQLATPLSSAKERFSSFVPSLHCEEILASPSAKKVAGLRHRQLPSAAKFFEKIANSSSEQVLSHEYPYSVTSPPPPNKLPVWTPPSSRKIPRTQGFISTLDRNAVSADFIDAELDLNPEEEKALERGDISEDVLLEGARAVIDSPAQQARRVQPCIVTFEWSKEDDELFEILSTAKKYVQESRVELNEKSGDGVEQRSLARVLDFGGQDDSDEEPEERSFGEDTGVDGKNATHMEVEIGEADLMDLDRIDASFDE